MPKASESVQVAIRVPVEWLELADEVAAMLSRPGLTITRTEAFRAAMIRGLEAIKAEGGAQPPAPPTLSVVPGPKKGRK